MNGFAFVSSGITIVSNLMNLLEIYDRYRHQYFPDKSPILIAIEFGFLPFDSPFDELQNQAFGKPQNYWSSETYLGNLVSGCSFCAF